MARSQVLLFCIRLWSYVRMPDRRQRHRDTAINRSAWTKDRLEYPDSAAIAEFVDIIGSVDEHHASLDVAEVRHLPALYQCQIDLEVLPQFVRVRKTGAQAAPIGAIHTGQVAPPAVGDAP